MAYWQRRPNGHVFVFVNMRGKGPKALPRAKTKHLDAEEDHNIDAWTNQAALQYEGKGRKVTPDNLVLTTSELGVLYQAYLDYLKGRKKRANTIYTRGYMLQKYVFPFFLEGDNPLRDPAQWPGKSIRMYQWMMDKGLSASAILKVNIALKGFYTWLVEEGRIQTGVEIKLRNPVTPDNETPLKKLLTPDDVIDFVKSCNRRDVRLMVLLGYFFSLRPQETFAVRKRDFVTGSRAGFHECAKVMKAKDLYSKLILNVQRQRVKEGTFYPPKAYSRGFVACFDETAAKMLVTELNEFKDHESILFDYLPDWSIKLWRRHGIPGITLKDLRRASIYHLGHHTPFQTDLLNLMKHARHRSSKTTELYLRRPEEDLEDFQELDLDA